MSSRAVWSRAASLFAASLIAMTPSCQLVEADNLRLQNAADSAASREPGLPAHHIRIYVSAVNCEMNAQDARRINTLASTATIPVEVIFTGIQDDNKAILEQATRDLGLRVPTRIARPRELETYKSIGGAYLPMALVTRARQLKTIIAGEPMPRTMSLLETSMSSIAGQ